MAKPQTPPFEQWARFFVDHEETLLERILERGAAQGYTRYSSTLRADWRSSVAGLTRTLVRSLTSTPPGGAGFTPEEDFTDDPISAFAIREARLHRERGVSLPMFLGLFKYYRRCYLDLLREEGGAPDGIQACARAVERCFDRLEIALCADWTSVDETGRIRELQARNRTMTNEKNRLLTLFESLVMPVFLLDDGLRIEAANRAAAGYFGNVEPHRLLAESLPWLAAALAELGAGGADACYRPLDVAGETARGRRQFKVAVARMSDVSDKFSGLTVVLDDITHILDIQAQLERERNRAASYLDIIGSVLLGLDASGNITLINTAGRTLLDRNGEDLVGRNWFDLAVPPDDRESLHNYFNALFVGEGNPEEEYVNRLTTRTGEQRIVAWKNRVIRNENGAAVGLLCAGNDITVRVEAQEKLREREMTYRALFENNHAVMLLVDPRDGAIRDANPAAAAFYGYTLERLRAMNMAEINILSEAEIYQAMGDARAQRRSCFLMRHRLSSGEVRDVEVYSGPLMIRGRQLLYSLVHDVTGRIRLEREMERMATTDALTGADNRHRFFQRAEKELKRAARYRRRLSVIMLDIDFFKDINDTYGHQSGDATLKAMAHLARGMLRATDLFGRLGGEEFAAVLPETGIETALAVAERLRKAVEGCTVRDEAGNDIHITVSLGVAGFAPGDRTVESIIRRADQALYRAKNQGRNRVERG